MSSGINEEAAVRMARDMAGAGLSHQEIIDRLVGRGVSRGVAVSVVFNRTSAVERPCVVAGRKEMVTGGLIFLVGVVVTGWSYMAAVEAGGGRFILAIGTIVAGGLQFFRGLALATRQ
jgi:hypothetical protein